MSWDEESSSTRATGQILLPEGLRTTGATITTKAKRETRGGGW